MAKTVIFDFEVVAQIYETALYLEETFGRTAAVKFTKNIYQLAQSLSRFPERGMRSSKFPDVRHINVSKYNKLYYRIEGSEVVILFLFDMRQNPAKDPYQ